MNGKQSEWPYRVLFPCAVNVVISLQPPLNLSDDDHYIEVIPEGFEPLCYGGVALLPMLWNRPEGKKLAGLFDPRRVMYSRKP